MLSETLRKLSSKPRFHGNGFTQLYLTPQHRLHVWDERLQPLFEHNATIHDHIFDMRSHVLMGEVVHRVYEEGTFRGDYQAFDRYRVDKEEDTLKLDREHVCYLKSGTYRMVGGSSYSFPVRHMHDTEVYGRAVTLMKKEQVWPNMEPWILCPVGEKPKDAFALDPMHKARNVDQLWDAIDRALTDISPWATELIAKVIAEK
jgi:hypothetical protein